MKNSNEETFTRLVNDIEETQEFANHFSQMILHELEQTMSLTICLTGTLGAGKTTFSRFLCQSLGVNADEVSSPTFSLHQHYIGRNNLSINHFDFYRFDDEDQIFEVGFEEIVEKPGIHLVEWGEKFTSCLPELFWTLKIHALGNHQREFILETQQ
jgi:tRNA threonylcarbamoyladenosine biosynthesis protein TsaE